MKFYYKHLYGNPLSLVTGIVERGDVVEVRPSVAHGLASLAKSGHGELLLESEYEALGEEARPLQPDPPIRIAAEDHFREAARQKALDELLAPMVQRAVDKELERLRTAAALREKEAHAILIAAKREAAEAARIRAEEAVAHAEREAAKADATAKALAEHDG